MDFRNNFFRYSVNSLRTSISSWSAHLVLVCRIPVTASLLTPGWAFLHLCTQLLYSEIHGLFLNYWGKEIIKIWLWHFIPWKLWICVPYSTFKTILEVDLSWTGLYLPQTKHGRKYICLWIWTVIYWITLKVPFLTSRSSYRELS